MELTDYVRVVRAHWKGVLALIVLGIVLAYFYTASQPKVYAADANGLVTGGAKNEDPALAQVYDSVAKSKVLTYAELAKTRAVAQRVIDDIGLDATPSSLIGRISVDQPVDTAFIKITARADTPEEAKDLADAWVRALAEQVEADLGSAVPVLPQESAALPSSPVSPRPRINLAAGFIFGTLAGLGYAVVRSRLDRRLRNPALVEKEFQVVTIGKVPMAKGSNRERASLTMNGDHANWGAGEAFRKLRTNLAYMNVDNPPKIIVVSSPQPGDGKSTVAANLAAAIGLSGEHVTLVDGDLRRPTVSSTLGLVEGGGLTDVLIGTADIQDVLQAHPGVNTVRVLGAGSVPPNPSELLGSQAMRNLLHRLAESGYVVIDAPPLLPVTDAAVLTRHGDGAIVVVSYGSTLDTELKDALANLNNVNGTVLGIVFNRIPKQDAGYTGYYGDYYAESTEPSPAKVQASKSKGRRRAT